MKLLAIDTAANLCAACVFDATEDRVLSSRSLDIGKGHVEALMPLIAEVLVGAGCGFQDISRIAVCTGPGSFTGVRVGVASARGLALALKTPAVGISTLEAIAAETRSTWSDRPVMVALDARREQIYTAVFDGIGRYLEQPAVSTTEVAAKIAQNLNSVVAGNAAMAVQKAAGSKFVLGPLQATAQISTIARLGAAMETDGAAPKPVYLRAPDAKPQSGFAVARAVD